MSTAARTAVYSVDGMTCGNGANSVGQAIQARPGVWGVVTELATGKVSVYSEREMTREIAAAVEKAGYQLTSCTTKPRAEEHRPPAARQ